MNNPNENEMQQCPVCGADVADYELKEGGCKYCVKFCECCLESHNIEDVRFVNADIKVKGEWVPGLVCEQCYELLWDEGDARESLIENFKI